MSSPAQAHARRAAVLDIDGTLVDSNYQHTLAWSRAFACFDLSVPLWRVHRAIGMGGDQLVTLLCGEAVERSLGDQLRKTEGPLFLDLIDEVAPLDGARDLVIELKEREQTVVLASSGKADEVDHYLTLLDVRDLVDGWVTGDDVQATKPDPDLIEKAVARAGGRTAVMVGDSVWDCEAAGRADLPVVAVRTGGFGEAELREAGAVAVFDSVPDLIQGLDGTPLRG